MFTRAVEMGERSGKVPPNRAGTESWGVKWRVSGPLEGKEEECGQGNSMSNHPEA